MSTARDVVPALSLLDDSLSLLRDHLPVLLSAAAFLISSTWLISRGFYLQQVTAAKEHRDYLERQLDDAERRLKELAPQSQATDLASLVDDLKARFIVKAKAWEALPANRLVHIGRNDHGALVVRLADRALALEAHGYVTEKSEPGAEVQVQRQGQFKLCSSPTGQILFLGEGGEPTESHEPPPAGIVQTVGTLGPEDICLFDPGMTIRV